MGWLAWERFRCNIDCKADPENCISENLFMTMAKRLAEDGFKNAGYEYIIIDDCWMTTQRDSNGILQADPERFPHGIKYLADYVHSLGLKMGIYQDIGTKTCIGYPGSQGYEKIDVDTFASWDIDYLKLDGCFMDPKEFDTAYPAVTKHLNKTGRPIVYSCSWPAYQVERKMTVNWAAIRDNCNLWRNYGDIQDSYDSITDIINWYAINQDALISAAGPGAWNDPDMLIIGNFGLSIGQCQSQMALWAIMAAPLMMSNDLRNLRPEFKEILLNRDIIEVDQDTLGIQGRQILPANQGQGVEVWRRPIMPVMQIANETWASFAVVCWNRRVDGMPFAFPRQLGFYGLTHPGGYYIKELFTKKEYGLMKADDVLTMQVNPAGGVFMFKATLAIALKDFDPHKAKESDLLRKRFKPAVQEVKRRPKYAKHRALPEDFDGADGGGSDGSFFALKFLAVIVVLAIVVRLAGFRFGPASLLRLSRRLLK
ncbi:Alpha-N-acetylgalactosaminidase [Hypsibius exemplaris]|uniref:Alpha-galactosidase n=1 Tax=Hypsibius exemplaris TaxID=2072580 RepID=A0A1W0WEV6_HYPEX|nr:Alpha-N-acetylgalactosaminidase [Hypsibius exemplaris]